MKITRVTQKKRHKGRCSVYVDGEYAFSVSDENAVKWKLAPGREISPEDREGLLTDEDKGRAFEAALRLLEVRSRSRRELQDRLARKELPPAAITDAIARLSGLGYIDDRRFAKDRTNQLFEKGKGPSIIRIELRRAGISPDIIASVLEESGPTRDDERERLRRLAQKKFRQLNGLPPETAARRLASYLGRRGFSLDAIRDVLKEMKSELPPDE